MKKINKKTEIYPYSPESIEIKLKVLYLLTLTFKTLALAPLIYLIIKEVLSGKLFILVNVSNFLITIGCLVTAILLSLISTRKNLIKNPLFLDDNMIISNKKKNNGHYENIYANKFKLLLGFNIICIIPLCFTISLTVSSLICLIFNLFPSMDSISLIAKYFLTLILLNSLSKTFNEPLIKYLRNKQD